MSAFLGPIHTWLFRKIKFQDELTNTILEIEAQEELVKRIDKAYVSLEQGELADIVDSANIHGWLQERISIVENRLAFVVTDILQNILLNGMPCDRGIQ